MASDWVLGRPAWRARVAVVMAFGVAMGAGAAFGQKAPEWTTSSYNQYRDAWQRNETKITKANVAGLKLLWKLKTDVKTMGMQSFREPLIVSGIQTAGGAKNVAIF